MRRDASRCAMAREEKISKQKRGGDGEGRFICGERRKTEKSRRVIRVKGHDIMKSVVVANNMVIA